MLLAAEHQATHHAVWLPPSAPPGRHHHLTPGPHSDFKRVVLPPRRRQAVDEFVLSQRVAAAANGCTLPMLAGAPFLPPPTTRIGGHDRGIVVAANRLLTFVSLSGQNCSSAGSSRSWSGCAG